MTVNNFRSQFLPRCLTIDAIDKWGMSGRRQIINHNVWFGCEALKEFRESVLLSHATRIFGTN